jgi:3-hydroxy acid dehydrogenase/malonic semialdehyde reductase
VNVPCGLQIEMKKNKPQNSAGVMLITGATSGFGESTAYHAAQAGFQLILTGRRQDRLNALKGAVGPAVLMILVFDVRDREATAHALASIPDDWVPDVLVNNAGLAVGKEPLDEGLYEDWDRMIDTNVKGLLHVSRELAPRMRFGSRIINMGSIAGRQAYGGGAVYNASKFAVVGLTQAMRIDLLPRGIQVSEVAPGAAKTEFSNVRFKGDTQMAEDVYQGFEPLSSQDVAEAVMFIAARPQHVCIQEILIAPAAQASVNHLRREQL